MDLAFLQSATVGLNTAAVILLTYMAQKLHDIDKRLTDQEKMQQKLINRLQHLSAGAGLPEFNT